MLPVLLAGASAVVWGAADYCGGAASLQGAANLRQRAVTVAVVSHLFAIPVILPFLLVVPGGMNLASMGWGAAAGIASLIGVIALNLGLASGAMATVAPVAAVTAAVVPLAGGIAAGERPAVAAVVGAGAAVVAIIMVSGGMGGPMASLRSPALWYALMSGVAFGMFFLLLGQAKGAGMWPLLADKLVSVLLGLAALRWLRAKMSVGRTVLVLAAVAGCCDTVATALYLLSANGGQISVVAPIAALYPASTVVLALIFNKERLQPWQFAGLGVAGLALFLAAS